VEEKSPRAAPAGKAKPRGTPKILLLYDTDWDAVSLTGKSLQFSGSVGKTTSLKDGKLGPDDVTAPESSCPRPPVTPPSIKTAPSVKAPLRLIPTLCFRTHALAQTKLALG